MKAGDKVVCINDKESNTYGTNKLVEGYIYTITEISQWGGLFLLEVTTIAEGGFWETRFRKVQPALTNAVTRKLVKDFVEVKEKVEPLKIEI